MNSKTLKQKYLAFFQSKKHAIIPGASLLPEHDPTVLFTTAGMHPLVPFLMGQKHPNGKRICNVQKCIRTGDIDEVGDNSHLSLFEMLGNWSLGDYFKREAIEWSFEFLTKSLKISIDKISVTVFAGDADCPRDEESAKIWHALGIPKYCIHYLPKKDNWWGPAGESGPCGPCTEMFIDTGIERCSVSCIPGCGCGKHLEIWNDVFMAYNKTKEGRYEKLAQYNVDTGMGVERTVAILNGKKSVYDIDVFLPVISHISHHAHIVDPTDHQQKSIRVIADHLRAATFILADPRAVVPDNSDQGYILRRFIRRSIRHARLLGITELFCASVAEKVIETQQLSYPELYDRKDFIVGELKKEEEKFVTTLSKGLQQFEKMTVNKEQISGVDAFLLFQSYGFPIEMVQELAEEQELEVDVESFWKEYEKHQDVSRVGAEKKFQGGLADNSTETVRLHTATHLLNEALRKVLSADIKQKGSNITPQRLRFDFNFPRKLTPEEIKKVEDCVNEQIRKCSMVERIEMPLTTALAMNAQAEFGVKYPDQVSVYKIGNFSLELCGGPHVSNTRDLGRFRIMKEEAVAAGVRRIKAVVE